MSLPPVFVFERHWDVAPKEYLQAALPKLCEEGYDTLCFEASHTISEEDLVIYANEEYEIEKGLLSQAVSLLKSRGLNYSKSDLKNMDYKGLAGLLRLYVSSQRYADMAAKIIGLDAFTKQLECIKLAQKRNMSIRGIDRELIEETAHLPMNQRVKELDKIEDHRIRTIVKQLQNLRKDGKSVIFLCGASHAERLLQEMKTKKVFNLYCFPHCTRMLDSSSNEIHVVWQWCPSLKKHTFCLENQKDCVKAVDALISKLHSMHFPYVMTVNENNSHIRNLNRKYGECFSGRLNTMGYLDAIISVNIGIHNLEQDLTKKEVSWSRKQIEKKTYFVIHAINTPDMVKKLWEESLI